MAVPVAFAGALVLVATVLSGGGGGGGAAAAAGFNSSAVPAAYRELVATAGQMCPPVLTPAILAAQLEQESEWDPRAYNAGSQASGIAQFIPGTWPSYGKDENGDGKADVWDPADAIPAAARYDCALAKEMQALLDKGAATGNLRDLMLAAYNAGPDRVRQFAGIPPYSQTQQYIPEIYARAKKFEALNVPIGTGGGSFGATVASTAARWIGTPYSWGGGTADGPSVGFGSGAGINGFDCSGLVIYAVAQAGGPVLPHSSQVQVNMGQEVDRTQMQPGDIIGFNFGGEGGGYSHIGIYVGGGQMVHAPKPGDVVKVTDLSDPYYARVAWRVRRFG